MTKYPEQERRVYADPSVYRRFLEFLGGASEEDATAVYITHADGCRIESEGMKPVNYLQTLMAKGWDIDRSLLDRKSLLVHLDVEYVNFDAPAECYVSPERSFHLQQPVIDVIESILLGFGIRPLHLLTGQGHHFVWRVQGDSQVATKLSGLLPSHCPQSSHIPGRSIREHSRFWEPAFCGLGFVMEYLAHRIKREAANRCEIPVEITAINVGKDRQGIREMVSIDISEYGDPLWTRVIRMPFSNYLKPWKSGLINDLGIEEITPPIFTIPLHEIDLATALQLRKSVTATIELAHRACVRIPEQTQGMDCLVDSYLASTLRKFHQKYDSDAWDGEVTEKEISGLHKRLPPCAAYIVDNPNDLLLKPSGMRLLTRCLLGQGFPPRRIAAMVAKIFKDDRHGWNNHWEIYSPEMRADFYTRLFAGQIATKLDESVDFNCVSAQEQGFCFNSHGCNLKPWRDQLAATKKDILL